MMDGMDERVTEHATWMASGAMQVRSSHPDIEFLYPLANWIKHETSHGTKIYRREIIVVSDWEEVAQ